VRGLPFKSAEIAEAITTLAQEPLS
jgi:hypothetical protein